MPTNYVKGPDLHHYRNGLHTQVIRGLEKGDRYIYMYLGILEAEEVKRNDMKQSILKEYDIFEKDQKDS